MESLMGLIKIRIRRGVNLVIRDVVSSDPYIVVKLGSQKLKTSVIHNSVNPEWNEDLTLSITDPVPPLKITVYDKDTFSLDDKMGDAEFDLKPFLEAVKSHPPDLQGGAIIKKVTPSRNNCLSEESNIIWKNGTVVQDVIIRLKNVESGEVEFQLHWVEVPGSMGM